MSTVDFTVGPNSERLGVTMAADSALRGNARSDEEDPLGAFRGIGLALLVGTLIWGTVFLVVRSILL
jgi:hypothetical protein